jgi:hypothetical protein
VKTSEMTTESDKTTTERNHKKNGFHPKNGYAPGHATNDKVLMNGDCDRTQFRDQVRIHFFASISTTLINKNHLIKAIFGRLVDVSLLISVNC